MEIKKAWCPNSSLIASQVALATEMLHYRTALAVVDPNHHPGISHSLSPPADDIHPFQSPLSRFASLFVPSASPSQLSLSSEEFRLGLSPPFLGSTRCLAARMDYSFCSVDSSLCFELLYSNLYMRAHLFRGSVLDIALECDDWL
jgi:hypothetical protein